MCDAPSVWQVRFRVARKEHWCCEGEHRIAPGERYAYVSGVWDGRGDAYKQCATCYALFETLSDEARERGEECGPTYQGLAAYIWEILR